MTERSWIHDPARLPDVRAQLARPERLAALGATGSLGTGPEEGLDRWTSWLSESLGVPCSFISLLDADRQIFKSIVGPAPPVEPGELLPYVPAANGLCQLVVAGGERLALTDQRAHPYFGEIAAGSPLAAYASEPVAVAGELIGTICVGRTEAREWRPDELTALRHAAAAVSAELSLQAAVRRLAHAQRAVGAQAQVHRLIAEDAPLPEILDAIALAAAREVGAAGATIVLGAEAHGPWDVAVRGDGDRLATLRVHTTADPPSDADAAVLADAASLARIAIERHDARERLTHRATHDVVTGLPNRALFVDRLAHALNRARRSAATTVVAFVDLDRFKLVNDSLGHAAGDELLVAVSERLSVAARSADTVARFGGDEFAVLAEDVAGRAEAIGFAERLLRALDDDVTLPSGARIALRASVGVAIVPRGDGTPDEVLRHADIAMYRAKRAGGGRIEFFDDALREEATRRVRMEAALRRALAEGELHVALQPIVALSGEEPPAVEALVRWNHPELGAVPPMTFIPIAEEVGLICEIGEWVLREACAATARLSATHGVELHVAVNLSPRQLEDPELVERVRGALRDAGLPGRRLALEITESALLAATDEVRALLYALRELGVRIVLDDFGTGFSSLSSLREHTVDAIKVDRRFVAGIGDDHGDRAIVTAIVGMAHALGCEVTGEGVEDEATLDTLRELGCDHVQGFLIARPAHERDVGVALGGILAAASTRGRAAGR